jgi:hypothetical protein
MIRLSPKPFFLRSHCTTSFSSKISLIFLRIQEGRRIGGQKQGFITGRPVDTGPFWQPMACWGSNELGKDVWEIIRYILYIHQT